jgi:hypothetical protein
MRRFRRRCYFGSPYSHHAAFRRDVEALSALFDIHQCDRAPTDLLFAVVAGATEGRPMSYRTIVCIAAALTLGVAAVSTEALAFRGGGARGGGGYRGGGIAYRGGAHRAGAYRGGVAYRGGAYRGAAYRGGVAYRGGGYYRGGRWYPGVAAGAAAVGAAAAAGSYYNNYYNNAQCGYYPYPPCQ